MEERPVTPAPVVKPPAPAAVPVASGTELHPFVRTGSGQWTCPLCKFVETAPGKLLVRGCPAGSAPAVR